MVVRKKQNNFGGVRLHNNIEEEIKSSLVDGKLPCAVAFQIAGKHDVSTKKIGDKANELNIKISKCQIGCFP